MKRIVLRIAALVTVLVLGFIAIAEAQRGSVEIRVSDADSANPTTSSDDQPPAAPRLFPTDEGNPLRKRRSVPSEVVQANAEEPKVAGPAPVTATGNEPPKAVLDPFARPISQAASGGYKRSEPAAAAAGSTTNLSGSLTNSGVSRQRVTVAAESNALPQRGAPAILDAGIATVPIPLSPGAKVASGPAVRPLSGPPLSLATGISLASGSQADTTPSAGATDSDSSSRRTLIPQPQPIKTSVFDGAGTDSSSLPPPAPNSMVVRGQAKDPSATPSQGQEPNRFNPDPSTSSGTLPTGPAIADRYRPFARYQSPLSDVSEIGSGVGDEPEKHERHESREGSGKPGPRYLEGPQAPQLTIHKTAPPEIQVGRRATFVIQVRNTGPVAAHNVEIRDEIPRGATLITSSPPASRGVRGELVWQLGTIKPGEEDRKVEVQLMPVEEGEIGSVATVSFNTECSAKSMATKPKLFLKTAGPRRVLIGEDVAFTITISNPGSGIAQRVVLEERVPPGLQHPAGQELVYEIGDLKPGESRQLELKLIAANAGLITNLLRARGAGDLRAESPYRVEVVAPQLDLAMEGPKRRFLEREATYTFSVSNPGTAPARQVQLIAVLPPGLKFVSANNAGRYEEATRTVHWSLEELPSKETGSVAMTTIPIEIGEHKLRLRGTADKGLSVEKEHPITVDGVAAVAFQVSHTKDPIEVGGETTYEIRVQNTGSKESTNAQVGIRLPPEMKLIAAEGPTQYSVNGHQVRFEPLQRLAPKAETTYRIRVQGIKPGDLRVSVDLQTDENRVPVVKEESTHVYADE